LGGIVYHVINRRVGGGVLFEKEGDYLAFEKVLEEACGRWPGVRMLAYCLMPTHWHLVVWPRREGELSRFMQWVTVTHMRRWHAHRGSAGTGPVYQGRFKSFPIEEDEHLLVVCRYVERNALRAGKVKRAEEWKWGSLYERGKKEWLVGLKDWPTVVRGDWAGWVNRAQTAEEEEALRKSVNRGTPFGEVEWQRRMAKRLKLESSLRDPWRPKKSRRKMERVRKSEGKK
jgi:putative transposase